MNIKLLKDIMKQVNAVEEFTLTEYNADHPLYWIWKVDNVKIKIIDSRLADKRKPDARFDVFIWGGYIGPSDYLYQQVGNDLHIKFIKSKFPAIIENPNDPNFGQPWRIESSDEVKIKGDLEIIE